MKSGYADTAGLMTRVGAEGLVPIRVRDTMAMSLAIIHSRALDGLSAAAVEVEVHLANGLPSFTKVQP